MLCPTCEAHTGPGAHFCPACGSKLPGAATAPAPPLDPGGETRLLTALFTDLSGSVAATRDLDPEAAAERVNEVLDVMASAIVRYEGHIDRYLGDGVLAFFGAPRAHEDDPIRAISAALEIRDRLAERGLGATSGINTGEVYLGRIGSQRHAESSALGPVINLAARLQSRAEPGQVLVGESTYRAARRWFSFQPVTVHVKGIPHPVQAQAALAPLPRPEKARGIEGLKAELVGRGLDLAELLEGVRGLHDGHGRAMAVIGEAGIGKSRLVAELKRHVDRDPAGEPASGRILWLEGRCLETTTGTSYGPFVDLFQSFFGVTESGLPAVPRIAAAVRDLVEGGELPAEREPDVRDLLANLLGYPVDDGLLRGAGPEQIRNLTFRAVRDVLAALARRQPLVIFLDDLHWADSHSLDLAVLLAADTARSRTLLLSAYRPDTHYPTATRIPAVAEGSGGFQPLRLRRLSEQESGRMLESLMQASGLPRRLRAHLLGRAEGNPLFLEEMLRSLLDAGVLVRRAGDWSILPEIEEVILPDSIQTIIQSRVDRLPPDRRQLLQAAAVIGRVFARNLLAAAAGTAWPGLDVEAALQELEDHELVYLDRITPEEEYSFKHVFTRDTVYGNLLRRQRMALHRTVAEATETLYPDAIEEHCEQLARHYDAADDAGRAVAYLAMAGQKAQRSFLNTAAIEYYQRALERLPERSDPA
ncbi:MAG TPA: AAA family ATPase, partial [Candidatus Polarisedimenticolia bacterium]|nr:AAA family ATPase [Candidatus Polarisedimenticolia bacterium]